MLLNVLSRLSTRCGELDSCGSGAASPRGRNRRRRARSTVAAVAAVAVYAALGVEPATAEVFPEVKIANASANEGDSMTFTVTLSGRFSEPLRVTPSFTDGTATKGTDYTANTAGIDFHGNDGEKRTFTVATTEDDVMEAGETFTVGLTVSETAEARFIVTGTATGTIVDDDTATVTIADASADEGDQITFTVTLDQAVAGGLTVTPGFTDGTATKGTDYTGNTAGISFAGNAGETKSFTVATTEDATVEPDETFTVSLAVSGSSETVTATDTATGTISNDDFPTLTIADASADEGDGITFTVTLDKAVSSGQFYVDPTFTDGTATKNTDYTVYQESLTFAGTAGETKSFTVATTEDTAFEPDETFTVGLTVAGTSATITATDTATGTIRNDDAAPPAVTIADAWASEGDGITFTVTLDKAVSGGLTVTPSFTDGTASKIGDYTPNTAALNFAGTAGETHSFTVATIEEQGKEGDETFTVSLTVSGTTATVTATDTATGTILDDDNHPPELTIADASADEGDVITFTVTLDRKVLGGLTVTPSFTDGTTEGSEDYAANTAGITFAGTAGESKTFTVATTEDDILETDEAFTVGLSVSGAARWVKATDKATGTIRNDEAKVALTIEDVSAAEGDELTFTATLDNAVYKSFGVHVLFPGGGTAVEGRAGSPTDWDHDNFVSGLSFEGAKGETQSFTVATNDDNVHEPDETFTVGLRVLPSCCGTPGIEDMVTATDTATGTILDDDDTAPGTIVDDTPALTIDDASAAEGDSITFTVTLDEAVSGGLTVTPSFTDGTAAEGTDYTENTAGLDFAGTAGETQTFTVATTDDAAVEPNETFTVSLTVSGTSETITATDTATGTILDDDDAPAVNLSVSPSSVGEGASATTVTVTAAFSTGRTFTEDRTVTVSVGGGTATSDTDYAAVSDFDITITTGATSGTGTFTLTPIQDTTVEGNETIDVTGLAGDLTVNGAALTLTDDDGAPAVNLSVSPSSVGEGAPGTTVTVTAALSTGKTSTEDRTVTVSIGGGTATSGTDYAAVSDFDIAITTGATSGTGTFTLTPIQDTAVEGNETIDVAGGAGNLTVNGTRLTLTDDDSAPAVNLSVSPSRVSEADASTSVTVTAAFSASSTFSTDTTVRVSVGGGTATSGTDYAAVSGFDIIIAKGATSGTGTFTLTPIQDAAVEDDETIDVAGGGGGLTVNGTRLTLTDDDEDDVTAVSPPAVNLSVSPSRVSEADASTTVTVTAAFSTSSTFSTDTTVRVSVDGGTATSGTDYAAVSDFGVTIRKGETSGAATFTLTPTADAQVEAAETIRVAGRTSGLTVNGTKLTLTDATPRLSVGAARAAEGETMVFTVALQSAGPRAVTVQYATADGSAAAGADYTSTSGQLVFSADETEHRVSVPVADDAEVEDNETFTLAVRLADAPGSPASATGTIVDNDVLTVTVTEPDVRETDGVATFTVSPSSASSYEVVVEYRTSDGTATAGADYVETTGELVFAPGETEKAVAVPVLDDDVVEGAETLLLSMTVVSVGSRASGSAAAQAPPIRMAAADGPDHGNPTSLQMTGTIRDDELARTRGSGTSRTLYLLARSMASEAVAAIGERFVATGGDDTPRATLGAAPPAGGVAGAGAGVAYPAASGAGGIGASPGAGQGAMALQRASDEPFADLGWLDNAHFSVPVGQANQSGRWQVWGRAGTVRSRLQTRTGGHARGDVFSSHVGVDTRIGDSALLGVSLSHTVGLLGYTVRNPLVEGALPGEGDGRVTSVQPYAHWAPRNGLTLWGMGGGGLGSLTLADSAGMVETPLGLRLFAGGARQALTAGLALKADAFHATLGSAEHADLAAATGTAMRGRMLAEGQTDWALSEWSSLNPRLEAGLRWDGGTDVEGMGAEMGVGLAYVNRRLNLGLETQGRYLVAHQADGFEEWGAGLSLRVGPGIDRPGPWLALNPEWGAPGSRVQALWDPRAAPELHRGVTGAPGARPDRIAATAGYRLSEANSVSLEALHETRPGDGGGIAARVTGNLSWGGGTDGEPRAPADSRFRRGERAPAGDAPHAGRAAPVRLDAVAVAAFYNLSGAPADDWIGTGVTETLTSALERLDAISVVGHEEAGGAAPAWLVAGEYRRRGDSLQIDARLVDTRSGAVAARSRAGGVTAELFELQDRITADLAGALGNLSAGGRAGAREPAARELPRRRLAEPGPEGGDAATAPQRALAPHPGGGRNAGVVEAGPSAPVRLDAVEARPAARPAPMRPMSRPKIGLDTVEARPSARRALAPRPGGDRDAGIVEGGPSAPLRLDAGIVEARSSAPLPLDTVAIDQFHDVSRVPADDWIGAGVAETLTSALEQLDAVDVVRNPGGSGPAAAWLVDGEYRRRGDRLQIDARVVDTRSGAVAARSSVEGATAEIFKLQDRLTADLAGVLGSLSTGGGTGEREPEAPERPRRRLAEAGSRGARIPADASGAYVGEFEVRLSAAAALREKARERLLASASRRADEFERAPTN